MTNVKAKKSSSLKKSIRTMIILASVCAILVIGYFAIVRPMLQQDEETATVTYDPIWASEVASVDGRVMMYPHYQRDNINKITVHNPKNAKFGEQYVDWGFYRYTGPEKNDDGLIVGDFYLQGYEYAPFDEQKLANMVVAAGYTYTMARVEDHCTDYSRYGLDYATPEEAVSLTMETADGKTFVYYIGDKTPSGGAYYVRVVGEDKLLATGETIQRDSVYAILPTNLDAAVLVSPTDLVTPTLTLPVDSQSTEVLDSYRVWVDDPKYFSDETKEDGTVTKKWKPAIYLKPISEIRDPFAQFSGLGIYYAESHPGYYTSENFESLVTMFADFAGEKVVELATILTDDEGDFYGFTAEVLKKYFLDDPQYIMRYRYLGADTEVWFSSLQEESYYYAYSLSFNTICKVTREQAYFLEWNEQSYLQNQVVFLNIDTCDMVQISGKYYDLGVVNPDRKGWQTVEGGYQLAGSSKDLVVTNSNGKTLDTAGFRNFYAVMINLVGHGTVTEEEAEAAMKNELMCTLSVTTRKKVIYKTDENGATTSEVDYVLESVTKTFRFYKLTDGRVLCTVEQIDAEGKSSGENGSFYVLTSRVEQLLAAAANLNDGETVDYLQRY